MDLFLLILTVFLCGAYNAILKIGGNISGGSPRKIYRFNFVLNAVTFLCLLITLRGQVSAFSIWFGAIFGVVTMLGCLMRMRAFSAGPMHLTTLITTSSMLIPTAYGAIFLSEIPSVWKLLAILVLLFFLYLSLKSGKDAPMSRTWIVFVALAFLSQGGVAVLQKIQQASDYKTESTAFLCACFFSSALCSALLWLTAKKDDPVPASENTHRGKRIALYFGLAAVCGVITWLNNVWCLRLVGIFPAAFFFPVQNGGALLLNALIAFLFFKEKMRPIQWVGFFGGVASLIAVALL